MSNPRQAARPHVVLLCSDQHRPDWIGCATESPGHRLVHTPTLDGLADRGVRFHHTYCAYPLCGPSRMALMTGRHASRLGMYVNEHTLRSDVPTFAHALGRAGYETVLCGRMHFSGLDQRHGFERRLVGDMNAGYGGGPRVERDFEAATMSDSFYAASRACTGENTMLRFDRCVSEAAGRYLADRDDERPLLLVASFFQPHHPFTAPAEYVDAARQRFEAHDPGPTPIGELHPTIEEHRAAKQKRGPDADQTREARIQYAAMIDYLDHLMGRVLDAASEHLDGPVLVLYVSDHGEVAGDRGLWGKGTAVEPSIKVPMIAAPLREADAADLAIAAGATVGVPASLLDVAPTLAGFADAPPLPGVDGLDLRPLLRDPAAAEAAPWADRAVRTEICIRFPGPDGRLAVNRPCTGTLRAGDWKLVYYHPEGSDWPAWALFNLADDPDEQHELAADPAHRATLDRLQARLLDGWNPDAVSADADARAYDLAYTTAWAREGGAEPLGPLERFDDAHPAYVFDFVGRRRSDLHP